MQRSRRDGDHRQAFDECRALAMRGFRRGARREALHPLRRMRAFRNSAAVCSVLVRGSRSTTISCLTPRPLVRRPSQTRELGAYAPFRSPIPPSRACRRRPWAARTFVDGLGYRSGPVISDPLQNVNLILCEHDRRPWIEIIYPAGAKAQYRTSSRIIRRVLYTIPVTLPTISIEHSTHEEAALRPKCVLPPTPAILFGGATVRSTM